MSTCPLKISAPDWCFFRDAVPAATYYPRLAALGVTGVEMVDPSRWADARAAGLAIINMGGPGMTQGLNRSENHAALLPAIREAIATAQREAIPAVIVFSGNGEPEDSVNGIMHCVDGLRELAPVAEAAGVTLLFEMLCTQDHPGYQAASSAYGFEVVRQVNSPAVKALYDLYHMYRMGEDIRADVLGNLAIIGHLHVANAPKRTKPVAGGTPDYADIVPTIQAAGYTGYWGLEFVPESDPLTEIGESVALFTGYMGCK
ncbi:MAG TPA: sugar phosphate isomerase/epimerase family protein [Armatimonadota bacterium]|jgi:hydroxypyruvate isomerase